MPAIANGVWAPSALRMRLTAITPATLLSLSKSAARAKCVATSPAEHAVSIIEHAPFKPNTYDTRPEAMEGLLPVALYVLLPSGLAGESDGWGERE